MHIHLPKSLHGWREFLKEIGIIVLGVLIALTAEQLVVWAHDRHLAYQARTEIQSELRQDLQQIKSNQMRMLAQQRQLEENLDQLESGAPDDQIIRALRYVWDLEKNRDSAWNAAKLDGALALIPPSDVAEASYVYESEDASDPIAYGYFNDMDSAAVIVDHARVTGRLTPQMRQQLVSATVSAAGRAKTLLKLLGYEQAALNATPLLSR